VAGGIDWFRWHHGTAGDRKFPLVAKRSGARVGDVIAMWAIILEQASANDERGDPGHLDFEAIDLALDMPDGTAMAIHGAMVARSLIDGFSGRLIAWEKRQPKREDETAAERKRRQREREHEMAVTEAESRDVTQSHAEVTHGHDREEESRGDTSTSLRSVEGASKRASRKCPTAFEVDDELRQWAVNAHPAVNLQAETAKLRDHTFKSAISDWRGAWRNWIRRADENAPKARGSPLETPHQRHMRERMAQFAPSAAVRAPEAPKQTQLTEVIDVTSRTLGGSDIHPPDDGFRPRLSGAV
jgi:hypothetical protein